MYCIIKYRTNRKKMVKLYYTRNHGLVKLNVSNNYYKWTNSQIRIKTIYYVGMCILNYLQFLSV